MRRLRWFCDHEDRPTGTMAWDSLLGDTIWSVNFQCRKCLRIKYLKSWSSAASARKAYAHYRDLMS